MYTVSLTIHSRKYDLGVLPFRLAYALCDRLQRRMYAHGIHCCYVVPSSYYMPPTFYVWHILDLGSWPNRMGNVTMAKAA